MGRRMTIRGYLPTEKLPADGLPPLAALPPCDGQISKAFIGKRILANAWCEEAVTTFAKQYGRTVAATLDLEIAALTFERDALKSRLEELQAG